MAAAERLVVPCSADGSSARAIDNLGALLYGVGREENEAAFKEKSKRFGMGVPIIHSVLLNRSTTYSNRSSKAFAMMFKEIERRVSHLKESHPEGFVSGGINFQSVPDTHSVAIVCSHLGIPLYEVKPGPVDIHGERIQVNQPPLARYKEAINELLAAV